MTTENITSFSGLLVQRHYRPGQKYVQLVFRTSQGQRLALSRNAPMVKSLEIGQTYQVSGAQRTLDGKTYVHEPSVIAIYSRKKFIRRNIKFIASSAVMVPVMAVAGIVLFASHDGGSKSLIDARKTSMDARTAVENAQARGEALTSVITNRAATPSPTTSQSKPATATGNGQPQAPHTSLPAQTAQGSSAQQPAAEPPQTTEPKTDDAAATPTQPATGGETPTQTPTQPPTATPSPSPSPSPDPTQAQTPPTPSAKD